MLNKLWRTPFVLNLKFYLEKMSLLILKLIDRLIKLEHVKNRHNFFCDHYKTRNLCRVPCWDLHRRAMDVLNMFENDPLKLPMWQRQQNNDRKLTLHVILSFV